MREDSAGQRGSSATRGANARRRTRRRERGREGGRGKQRERKGRAKGGKRKARVVASTDSSFPCLSLSLPPSPSLSLYLSCPPSSGCPQAPTSAWRKGVSHCLEKKCCERSTALSPTFSLSPSPRTIVVVGDALAPCGHDCGAGARSAGAEGGAARRKKEKGRGSLEQAAKYHSARVAFLFHRLRRRASRGLRAAASGARFGAEEARSCG